MEELSNRIGKIIFLICTLFFIGSFLFFAYVMWGEEILHPDDPFGDMNEDILEEVLTIEELHFLDEKIDFTSATLMGAVILDSEKEGYEKEGYYNVATGVLLEDSEDNVYCVHMDFDVPKTFFDPNSMDEDRLYTLINNIYNQFEYNSYSVQKITSYKSLNKLTAKYLAKEIDEGYTLKENFVFDVELESIDREKNKITFTNTQNARYVKGKEEKILKMKVRVTLNLTDEEMEELVGDKAHKTDILDYYVTVYENNERGKYSEKGVWTIEDYPYLDRNITDFDDIEKKGFWFFK